MTGMAACVPCRWVAAPLALLLACGLAVTQVQAQGRLASLPGAQTEAAPVDPGPRSGDAWADARIADISLYGQRYRAAFVDELARYHDAPRPLVEDLLAREGWTPGDVYFACALGNVAGRPCATVAAQRSRAPDAGWEAVATVFDVGPGSAAFERLKRGMAESYARWNRPLPREAGAPRMPAKAAKPKQRPGKQAPPANASRASNRRD